MDRNFARGSETAEDEKDIRPAHPSSPVNCAPRARATLAWGEAPGPCAPTTRGLKARAKWPACTLLLAAALPLLLIGCKSAPAPATPAATPTPTPAATYPARPAGAPAAFKVFHHANSSFTLVVNEKATDDQISALIWQLRDAARNHTFDAIHIPQKQVDADGKTVWFHIYRGAKCAPEKYGSGAPPCGASYHAAADYTFDTHSTPPWDKGVLMHTADDPHPTLLWDPDAPYTPATK